MSSDPNITGNDLLVNGSGVFSGGVTYEVLPVPVGGTGTVDIQLLDTSPLNTCSTTSTPAVAVSPSSPLTVGVGAAAASTPLSDALDTVMGFDVSPATGSLASSNPTSLTFEGCNAPQTLTITGGAVAGRATIFNFDNPNTGPCQTGSTCVLTGRFVAVTVPAPVVTINDIDPDIPLTPAITTFDVDWEADQLGDYSIRVGGTDCTDGTEIESGTYAGPAGTETTDTLNTSDLAYGANTVRVCVDNGFAAGFDEETVYRQVPTTLTYTGLTTVTGAQAVTLKGTLADGQTACDVQGQEIDFWLDSDDDGLFEIGEKLIAANTGTGGANTNNSATAERLTQVLQPGIYGVKLAFAGTNECAASETEVVLSVVNPDDAANGGGWYQIAGVNGAAKSVNYGFTTRWDRKALAYRGELLVHNKTAWRMKGDILGFAKTSAGTTFPKKGEATGVALLQCWDSGTETWKTADESVTFKIAFTDTGTPNKKTGATKPDSFTVKYVTSYTPQNSCPASVTPLVQSTEQALKGGNILVK